MKAQKVTQTFNGLNVWGLEGRYFKLLETVSPVAVELWLAGRQVLVAAGVEGGFYLRAAFDQVRITTPGNEAVSFLVADEEGGSDRFTGNFSISSPLVTPGDADAAAAALIAAARLQGWNGASWDRIRADPVGGAGAMRVSNRGVAPGAYYQTTTPLAINTPGNIVAAASNNGAGGMTVHKAGQIVTGAGGLQSSFLCKATAPAGVVDGNVLQIVAGAAAYADSRGPAVMPEGITVASGLRLDRISGAAETLVLAFAHYTLHP